jgi:hypothetical protein
MKTPSKHSKTGLLLLGIPLLLWVLLLLFYFRVANIQGRQHLRCLSDEIPRAACYMGSYVPLSYSGDLSGCENDSRAAE